MVDSTFLKNIHFNPQIKFKNRTLIRLWMNCASTAVQPRRGSFDPLRINKSARGGLGELALGQKETVTVRPAGKHHPIASTQTTQGIRRVLVAHSFTQWVGVVHDVHAGDA